MMIDSGVETIDESLAKIVHKIEELGYMPPAATETTYTEEEEAAIEKRLAALGYL